VTRPRPECPSHPRSRVWLDGTYGRGRLRRQRFKCVPGNGERRHVFTELLPRTISAEHECLECERPLASHEGPPAPRRFEYTTREIAEALIMVGGGATYRGAGRDVRELAHRTNGRYRRFDGSNIADWVELFAPAIFEAHRPHEWPQIVAIDALPFAVSGQRTNAFGHPIQGGSPAFQIFGAMGYVPFHYGEVKLVGLQGFPGFAFRQGRPYWVEFLRSLDAQLAGAPRQFVCDGDPDIEAAIREVWPRGAEHAPEVFICHHHLREGLLERLRHAQIAADDPLYQAAERAFDNSECWDGFERLAQARRREISEVTTWLRRNGNRAADQIAHRTGHVTDTTAIEQYFSVLRGQLASRRGTFGNRERLNRLLMLMMLRQRRSARLTDYAHIIREQLLANDGRAGARRQIDDPDGQPSLGRSAPARPRPPAPPRVPIELGEEEDIPF